MTEKSSSTNMRLRWWTVGLSLFAIPLVLSLSKFLCGRGQVLSPIQVQVSHAETCPERVAVLMDMGRMGNMFFEYLGSKLMAHDMGYDQFFITHTMANFFDQYFVGIKSPAMNFTRFEQECHVAEKRFVQYLIRDSPKLEYHRGHSDPLSPYIKIYGYPEDLGLSVWRKLFAERQSLLKEFEWRPELVESIRKQVARLTASPSDRSRPKYSVTVGVHARMRDYHNHMNNLYGPSRMAGLEYFNRAMNFFRNKYENPLFLVVSNDIQWCMNNMEGDDIIYPGAEDETDPGWDLAIVATCDHLIITYGTFGMTAAYLNAGQIVAADNFTTLPNVLSQHFQALNLRNWHWMTV